jgi:hypothetical protein
MYKSDKGLKTNYSSIHLKILDVVIQTSRRINSKQFPGLSLKSDHGKIYQPYFPFVIDPQPL